MTSPCRLVVSKFLHENPEYKGLLAEKARAAPNAVVNLPVYSGPKFFAEVRVRRGGEVGADTEDAPAAVKTPYRTDTIIEDDAPAAVKTPYQTYVNDDDVMEVGEDESASGIPAPPRSPVPDLLGRGDDNNSGSGGMDKIPAPRNTLMTFNRLRRLNVIMELIEKQGVVSGLNDIAKVRLLARL